MTWDTRLRERIARTDRTIAILQRLVIAFGALILGALSACAHPHGGRPGQVLYPKPNCVWTVPQCRK